MTVIQGFAIIVRWFSEIVTEQTKAPILAHRFFMMYLMILEGVPSKVVIIAGIIKWLPVKW